MRKGSIHILQEYLPLLISKAILDDIQYFGQPVVIDKAFIERISNKVVYHARGYALSNRKITVTNDKLKRDANRVSAAGRSDTSLFSKILTLIRQKAKHRGVTTPKVGSDEWLAYKEATKHATEFCQEFGLSLKEGYTTYIGLGLDKMKNFSIYKFKTLHGPIIRTYEAIFDIKNDPQPLRTQEIHKLYLKQVANRTGMSQGYEGIPEKYTCFVKAAQEAKDMGATLEHYISAQFEAFEWCNSIPDPAQLYGEKARDRVIKYYFAHEMRLNEKTTLIDFKSLRNKNETIKH